MKLQANFEHNAQKGKGEDNLAKFQDMYIVRDWVLEFDSHVTNWPKFQVSSNKDLENIDALTLWSKLDHYYLAAKALLTMLPMWL